MKVVIVDDFLTNATVVKSHVAKLDGVEPVLFTDSRDALAWCLANQPDLILVDYMMPDMDGLEFIRRYRAERESDEIPIVMITAAEEKEIRYKALESGANDFLGKPVDHVELRARTRNMLRLRARSLALAESNRQLSAVNGQLAQANQRLHELATTDSLTGAPNRRHFFELSETELSRARRYGNPLSVMMIDADRFKTINDRHGHAVGDAVLRAMVQVCRGALRQIDVLGRLGGEEFAVCLPQTAASLAREVAERLRQAMEATPVAIDGGNVRFTVSIGIAQTTDADPDIGAVLARADEALYRAKETGRNRVLLA